MTKYDTSSLRIRVDFSKEGRGRFERTRVGRDLNAFRLCHDLAEYIERHIDAGRDMTEMFTVRYEGGIFLTVYLCSGVFYITDVTDAQAKRDHFPARRYNPEFDAFERRGHGRAGTDRHNRG